MNKRNRIVAATACAVFGLFGLTACGHDNYKDLKNVNNVHPGYIENDENMDGHPNIGFLCIHGVPVLTTTRSYNALTIVPPEATAAYDFCAQAQSHE